MATDTDLISDEFSDIACSLMKEYSSEIEKLRLDSIRILDSYYNNGLKTSEEKEYLARKFQYNLESFLSFLPAYQSLVRKASQWIEHAHEARPAKQLELEVRLNEFEKRLDNTQNFLISNQLNTRQ